MSLCYKWMFTESPDAQWAKGGVEARIRVPAQSPWFDGHFPEEPILPGVAQVALAQDLLCQACGRSLPVARVSRVRFKQMIRPDQRLTVAIQAVEDSGNHRFRILGDDGLICSGQIRLAETAEDRTVFPAKEEPHHPMGCGVVAKQQPQAKENDKNGSEQG